MAVIVNYTDLVSLADAKSYLRIDDAITDVDNEITLMINSACNLVENYTQVYLKPQSKEYYFNGDGCIRVYAYPINAIPIPADATTYDTAMRQLYTAYTRKSVGLESMTFDIGHTDTENVKPIFSQAILETVKLWFFGSETETAMKSYIPNSVMAILSSERRFIF